MAAGVAVLFAVAVPAAEMLAFVKVGEAVVRVVHDGPDTQPSDLVHGVAVPQLDVVGSPGRQHVVGAHDGGSAGPMACSRSSGTIVPAVMYGAASLTAAMPALSRTPRR
jgi:hypothetical protein